MPKGSKHRPTATQTRAELDELRSDGADDAERRALNHQGGELTAHSLAERPMDEDNATGAAA